MPITVIGRPEQRAVLKEVGQILLVCIGGLLAISYLGRGGVVPSLIFGVAALLGSWQPLRPLALRSRWEAARQRAEPLIVREMNWSAREDLVIFYFPDLLLYVARDQRRGGALELYVDVRRGSVAAGWCEFPPGLQANAMSVVEFLQLPHYDLLASIAKVGGNAVLWAHPKRGWNKRSPVVVRGPRLDESLRAVSTALSTAGVLDERGAVSLASVLFKLPAA